MLIPSDASERLACPSQRPFLAYYGTRFLLWELYVLVRVRNRFRDLRSARKLQEYAILEHSLVRELSVVVPLCLMFPHAGC